MAVISLPDDKWGEVINVVVALVKAKEQDSAELRTFAEPHLTKFKLPSKWNIVPALARNPAGKVLKFVLKQ